MIPTASNQESLLSRLWPVVLVGGAWLWLFWPMMTGQSVVGFRDSAYLYYPLFQWIDAQWAAGEIPLWNPYCNFGMPVVADGTSSVFYPGKLVFFCRFLSYPARYGIYIAIHVPIAAAGAYWFARTLRANRAGATLAAFSFAFGGSVLFQTTNVIYLVSAAWLPFALCCVWKIVKTGEIKWAVAAGVCCALMILGGDPQMVYHVGLIAAATIFGEWIRRRRRRLRTSRANTTDPLTINPTRWLLGASVNLILMVAVTSLLAAIQLLPTFYWAQHSERTNPELPANIHMAARVLADWNSSQADDKNRIDQACLSLIGHPAGTTDHAYQFSQPPWSVLELLWPNISGKPFPIHQRWTSSLPGADRIWVPSLYVGLLVLWLGLFGMRLWGRKRKQVWLSRLFVFFLLGSFGWYGAVWLVNEVASPENPGWLGPQVGGVYWAMNMLLPKYFAFRYPAKLFVIASLAISILAATNLRPSRMKQVPYVAAVFVMFNLAWLVGFRLYLEPALNGLMQDRLFGLFDSQGSARGIYFSIMHSMVIATGIGLLMWMSTSKNRKPASPRTISFLLVLLTIIDVLVANSWLVPMVDSAAFESNTKLHQQLTELKESSVDVAPIRVFRSSDVEYEPVAWELYSSENRLQEIVQWQRESLYPKHHLGEDVILLGSFSSIWPAIYQRDLAELERYAGAKFSRRPFHAVIKPAKRSPTNVLVQPMPNDLPAPSPIFWLDEVQTNGESKPELPPSPKITQFEINRIVARVTTDQPRFLVCSQIADLGWKAIVRDLATNESKSVAVTAAPQQEFLYVHFEQPGQYEVEFTYSPVEFWVGLWISLFAWILLVGGFAFFFLRNRRLESQAKVC